MPQQFFLLATFLLAGPLSAAAPDFDRDIRPILSDKCFKCHGPDGETRQAELRLDTRDGAIASAVVPGKPDESELIARITSTDTDERMPPPETKLSLSAADQELIRQWIADGAKYSEHWSFQPLPASVPVPEVHETSWPKSSVDRFVLARLESTGMKPTRRAEPWRLLRRMTLDLTGLPPTADDVAAFEKAAAKDLDGALAAAADRLLASPAYGENVAVAWLDAARYADSYGYQSDQLNTQWPYRDWVVRAFNQNLPYNEFLTWQLAGDLLPNATRDQILATAFNRMHRMTNEGGSIAEEWLAENAADRVQTMASAMLGLTLECARCHDHKYDPILTRDYYSLTAFFNSIDENGMYDATAKTPTPSLLLPTDEQNERLEAARHAVKDAEAAVSAAQQRGEKRFEDWLAAGAELDQNIDLVGHYRFDGDLAKIASKSGGKSVGNAAELSTIDGRNGRAIRFDGDHGASFPGLIAMDRWQPFTIQLWLRDNARNQLPVVVAQRCFGTDVGPNGFDLMLEDGVLTARLYRVWPGNGIGVQATEPILQSQWQDIFVTYDGSSRAAGLKLYRNGQLLPTKIVRDKIYKSVAPATYGDGAFTLGQRFRDRGFKDGDIDELRVYSRALEPLEIGELHQGASHAVSVAAIKPDELRKLYFSTMDSETRQASAKLQEARQKFVAIEDELQEVSVMGDLPEPRPTYILPRGRYDAPKTDANRVTRDVFKQMLGPFPAGAPRNRLGLVQWLTAPDHPLAARVEVNRLWVNFFGRGLVATPENFGRQGAAPTHPELLDWLARDLVEHGWDLKRLCREIVLSATYQQDSRTTAELRKNDPENRLLARGPSRRLSAEQIRDVALAASSLLVKEVGGPPVYPYQPGGDLWRESNSMSPAYQQSHGKDLLRRSLYSMWKRTAPLPNMTVFDAPTREVCTISRGRTATPLQALVLLNDVQFVEPARALAVTVAKEHASLADRITAAFTRLAGRGPDPSELILLADIYQEQLERYKDQAKEDASKLVKLGETATETTLSPPELAALTVTCQAILNSDATAYER
jgi:hypothetical protein